MCSSSTLGKKAAIVEIFEIPSATEALIVFLFIRQPERTGITARTSIKPSILFSPGPSSGSIVREEVHISMTSALLKMKTT